MKLTLNIINNKVIIIFTFVINKNHIIEVTQ